MSCAFHTQPCSSIVDPSATPPSFLNDANTRLGEVIGKMKVRPESPEDDVVDHDLILVWAKDQHRIITGGDLLGRLLRGIAIVEKIPDKATALT